MFTENNVEIGHTELLIIISTLEMSLLFDKDYVINQKYMSTNFGTKLNWENVALFEKW